MMELDYGRKPLVVVELFQPRCSLRFGALPCLASGSPLCYQTWGTCRSRATIDTLGSITWRFTMADAGIMPMYERDGEHIKTNPIPLLVSASTTSSEINISNIRDGKSPLGVRGTCTVTFRDDDWDDHVGDFNLSGRASVQGRFWQKWRARNVFYSGMMVRIYEGYVGQSLAEMQRRDYVLDKLTGPDSGGRVTITGRDPLRLAELRSAQFPRLTAIRLVGEAPAGASTISVTTGNPADLTDSFGNTAKRYLGLGEEIISYDSASLVSGTVYSLSGVARGALGTASVDHAADAAAQRVGRHENLEGWKIAADLLDSHTTIPAGYRDAAGWTEEGEDYLSTQRSTRTIPTPRPVDGLVGELCQQFNFVIWWDERLQKIPLLPNRPPREAPIRVTDDLDILRGSVSVADDPEAHVTRVGVYYSPRSPFASGNPKDYEDLWLSIEGDIEAPAAAGAVKTLTIFADWISNEGDALDLASRILLRYRLVPRYMSLKLDAKHRAARVGSVLEVTSDAWADSEGRPIVARWQINAANEPESSHTLSLRLQSYTFIGRFSWIMADGSTENYVDAADDEKELGCYMADDITELMPNGDEPYLLQ